ncbi:MAG: SEC-C metal-binding domain-containing protein [Candidatus Krumholzibacteriaceae bacterium]|jgi:predicted aspartyl protease
MPKIIYCFTVESNGIARVLKSKVTVQPPSILHPAGSLPPPAEFTAIWDTGATATAITQKVVDSCGLKPTGMTRVSAAGGEYDTETYFVDLELPNHVTIRNIRVTKADVRDADVLIGMDIISSGDLAITNHNGKTVFTFRLPSDGRIDFVDLAKRLNPKTIGAHPRSGRNDPCPCGSGKKYKKCHGLGNK